ncbi:uncharacterized protein [Drosophila pseudoobscura]|uniref:Salivary secreted peptide n=1 Tax=Drosophila pseudoobscura pseudoobscura TaxID=46245 RepID=A0A6I8VFY6_DROPS|nr:uncharacterized protein LOC26533432 [Drosophila pseudoobscura]
MGKVVWLLLSAILLATDAIGYSVQFGMMQSQAVPIYEMSYNISETFRTVEITQKDKLISNINLILVLDESQVERVVVATILTGGIGCNYTILQFTGIQPEESPAIVTVLIYGLPSRQASKIHLS